MSPRESSKHSPESDALVQKALWLAAAIGVTALAILGFRELIDAAIDAVDDKVEAEFEVDTPGE